jgi:hypothetical protein
VHADIDVMFHRIVTLALALAYSHIYAFDITGISLPLQGRYVLPANLGPALLQQCSRTAPSNVTEFWVPSEADIVDLEQRLSAYLLQANSRKPPADSYHRQYIGFIRNGTRLIYGSFYAASFPSANDSKAPVMICDGGPAFWGIVFNTDTKVFTEIQFNGYA